MTKRTITVFMIILLALSFTGCAETEHPEPVDPTPADMMNVVDKKGNMLGQIPVDAACTAIDGGIFYSISHLEGNYGACARTDYYCFWQETGESHHVVTIDKQSYETTYFRTEYDGRIYTLFLEGDPFDYEPDVLELLVVDKTAMKAETYTVSDNGFPYAFLTVANGKILIMNHEISEKRDVIYEFVSEEARIYERQSFSADKDSLRGICGYHGGIYLLRLQLNGSSETKIYLDYYDMDYSLIKSQPLSESVLNQIVESINLAELQEAINELSMNVSCFSISDEGYLIYGNFGMLRMAYSLNKEEVVLIKSDEYSVLSGYGKPALYRIVYEENTNYKPEIIEIRNGKPVSYSLTPTDSTHKMLWELSRSPSGTWLAKMINHLPLATASVQLLLWSDD